MTRKRRSTRRQPDAPAASGPFDRMAERMPCQCAEMMSQMMSKCGGMERGKEHPETAGTATAAAGRKG